MHYNSNRDQDREASVQNNNIIRVHRKYFNDFSVDSITEILDVIGEYLGLPYTSDCIRCIQNPSKQAQYYISKTAADMTTDNVLALLGPNPMQYRYHRHKTILEYKEILPGRGIDFEEAREKLYPGFTLDDV